MSSFAAGSIVGRGGRIDSMTLVKRCSEMASNFFFLDIVFFLGGMGAGRGAEEAAPDTAAAAGFCAAEAAAAAGADVEGVEVVFSSGLVGVGFGTAPSPNFGASDATASGASPDVAGMAGLVMGLVSGPGTAQLTEFGPSLTVACAEACTGGAAGVSAGLANVLDDGVEDGSLGSDASAGAVGVGAVTAVVGAEGAAGGSAMAALLSRAGTRAPKKRKNKI